MLCKIILLTLLGFLISESSSSKILVVHTTFSRSHMIVGKALYTELAKQGHDVTVITTFPLDKPLKNYRDIHVPLAPGHMDSVKDMMEDQSTLKLFQTIPTWINMMETLAIDTVTKKEVVQLMKEETFDLVILGYFLNEYYLGFGAHFKCPTVILFSGGSMGFLNRLVANPHSISNVPHLFMGQTGPMSFRQRITNLVVNSLEYLAGLFLDHINRKTYKKLFPLLEQTYDQNLLNVSLVFTNSHFSQGVAKPNQQNMIEIGGIQAKDTPSPLPEDIKEWLDSAKDGAIFMSLGSNIKSSFVPRQKLEAILKTFGKLKQKILWKWEDDQLPGKPDNVKIGKWLPQDDILAHPNIKLFVTHGGLGSVTESKFHGVPIVGIPMFGDQSANVDIAQNEGWARYVHYENITEASFTHAVTEVLLNDSYSNKVKEISNKFRDRPVSALKTAVYWTEYVIRYRGAKHLQSNAVHLNFFEMNLLDIWACILILVMVVVKIQIVVLKLVYRKVVRKLCKKNKIKRKKN